MDIAEALNLIETSRAAQRELHRSAEFLERELTARLMEDCPPVVYLAKEIYKHFVSKEDDSDELLQEWDEHPVEFEKAWFELTTEDERQSYIQMAGFCLNLALQQVRAEDSQGGN